MSGQVSKIPEELSLYIWLKPFRAVLGIPGETNDFLERPDFHIQYVMKTYEELNSTGSK